MVIPLFVSLMQNTAHNTACAIKTIFGAASLAKRNGGEATAVAEAKTTYTKGRVRKVGKNMPRKPVRLEVFPVRAAPATASSSGG